MTSGSRRLPTWAPWAVSAIGAVAVAGAYFLDRTAPMYSFWLSVLTNCGVALALAAPVTILTRRVADDLAVDLADVAMLDDDEDADESQLGTPAGPRPVLRSYRDAARLLENAGWTRTSTSSHHEVWRHGRDRILLPRTPHNPGTVYERVINAIKHGETQGFTRLP